MNRKVKAVSAPLAAFGATFFGAYFAFRVLEHYVIADPGNAFVYVLLEWMALAIPAVTGSTLLLEEATNRGPPQSAEAGVDAFLRQLEGGKMKVSPSDAIRITAGLEKKLRIAGQKVTMKVVAADEQKTGVQVERSIS